MARILVIEDKAALRAMVARLLEGARAEDPHTVDPAADAASAARQLAAQDYDLVISDVRLPDADGFALLAQIRQQAPETEVILMTAYATVEAAVAAVKGGAYDYLAKPFEPDELLLKVARALERRRLRARALSAEAALRRREGLADLLGDCPPLRRVRDLIARVADLDVTVLLSGESGTGKEVAARAIHRAGLRRARPFVAINCGALPEQLLESELFGHAKGAFTGAGSAKEGLVEEAADGTLFLDEIGDLPLDLQVKLNRALQERSYRRVGEARERRIAARIIAATHRDLKQRVAEGAFREDLYFRLAVFPIELPPLRARGDDVLQFAQHFLAQANQRFGRAVAGFTPEALRALAAHPWPGNVRELGHAVERAVILAAGDRIGAEDLPETVGGALEGSPLPLGAPPAPGLADLSYRDALEWARDRALRQYLDALLRRHAGNVTQAARQAEVERESLHRLLRQAGLDAQSYRPD